MNALFAPTWYDDTAIAPPRTTPPGDLSDRRVDTVIIGGGLAGLTTLLHLAEAGVDAVLLEAHGLAAGASGRNGGFCTPGWAADEAQIARTAGGEAAQALAAMSDDGLTWMRGRMQRPDYRATEPKDGLLVLTLRNTAVTPGLGERLIEGDALKALLSSPRYRGGLYSGSGLHFHPLNFMRLLARDAMAAGGRIGEGVAVASINRDISGFRLLGAGLGRGLAARRVVLATGGYGGAETGFLARHLLAIRTYIGVSDPMPAILDHHIRTDWAIADTRRAGNYYRRLPDGRLLWGMGITAFGTLDVDRVRAMVQKDIAAHFPAMAAEMRKAGIGIGRAWAGNMGYARHFLPYVGDLGGGLYSIAGFGGHGMNTAPAAAAALAAAMTGRTEALAPFDAIPRRRVWGRLGALAAETSYRWRIAQDALAERRGGRA